jgi:hypothetical protein
MKTLKDLGEKHYEDIRYSFDVYYYPRYDDMYVGTFKNIMEMSGYEAQFKAPTMEELVKIADQFLDMVKHIRVDRTTMKGVVWDWCFNNSDEFQKLVETHNELQDAADFPENKVKFK